MRYLVGVLACIVSAMAGRSISQATTGPIPAWADVYIALSDRLLVDSPAIKIDQSMPVQSFSGDYPVSGMTRTIATADLGVVPNARFAQIRVMMQGAVYSSLVTDAGMATIYTSGTTPFRGVQNISFSEKGLWSGQPELSCSTRLFVTGVEARGPLIERLAWRRAERMLPDAEFKANQEAHAMLLKELNKKIALTMRKANSFLLRIVRPELARKMLYPRSIHSATSAHWLLANFQFDSTAAVAELAPPPPWKSAGKAMVLLSQTFVDKIAHNMWSKQSLSGAEIAIWLDANLGSVPPELQPQEQKNDWALEFAETKPVEVRWQTGNTASIPEFKLSLNLARAAVRGNFSDSEKLVLEDIKIQTSYRVSDQKHWFDFVQTSPVVITSRSDSAEAKALLRQKVEALLAPTLHFASIEALLDSHLSDDQSKTRLRFDGAEANDDWLLLSWR